MSVEAERPATDVHPVRGMARLIRHTAENPDARPTLIHRVVLVLAAFSLFSTLLAASGPTVRWSVLGLVLALGVCALVTVIVLGFTINTMRWFGRAEGALLLIALGALALWTIANILNSPAYRSDEEIFVQYSANLLRHGHNPYGADMMPAYAQYPSPFPTKLLDGGITHSLDYPALPTLLTTLLTLIVGDFHTVALLCTLALFATALIMFRLLPRGLRSLAPLLVVGIPVLASGSSGGLLFTLVLAPLAFVAYRWQHTGETGRLTRLDLAKAAAVGIAVSTTQVAWFPIPFLFLGIYLCRERDLGRRAALKVIAKFAGAAFATFFAINAVFIFWGPKAWLHGTMAPIIQHAVPEGQGLINLIQSLSIGSGNLSLWTYAGALVMLGLLVAYWRHFDVLKNACFALPLIGLLFPARSYWTYFIAYGAAWMVELLSHDPARDDGPAAAPRPAKTPLTARIPWLTKSGAITTAAFLPAVLALGAAFASPQPLSIDIDGKLTSAQLASIQTVNLTVTNNSGKALTPHFMAVHGSGLVSATWNIVSGPQTLAPHGTAHYTIVAPSLLSMPPIAGGLKIQAVTDTPPTISYSKTQKAQPYVTLLSYKEPTTPLLEPNQTIVLTARAQTEFGETVHKTGMRICLAQVKFANSGDLGTYSATITPSPAGDQVGCGLTDANGEVRFSVVSTSTAANELFFQSYGQQGSYGTFGYSGFVTAAWR